MTVVITHSTPSDATFSATGATAWDANHTLTGLGTMAEQNANNVNITGGSITGVTGVGTVTSVTGTAPISVATGTTTPVISMPAATTSVSGYLTNTDWTTFNNKQPAGSYLTAVTADAPLSGSGTSGSHLVIATANTTTTGALSSTDWNTFNNKGNGTVTSVSGTGTVSGISLSGTVTSSGSLTLGGTLDLSSPPAIGGTTANTGIFSLISSTRINPRVTNITSSSTITPPSDTVDQYSVTALAVPATIAIPSGTAVAGQKLTLRIKDDGTAKALTWTTSAGGYRVIGSTLPTTTVASKVVYIGCIYNATESFWDVVSVAQQV
jgi:hypothetical protein